jgi:maleate isomerase
MTTKRVGLVVPSSNITVETELPRLLSRHEQAAFSFHSSRMRMRAVSAAELAAMNAQRERCVLELGDAKTDVLLYACLVALMVSGPREHTRVESLIAEQLAAGGSETRVRSSAGALVEALDALKARRVALVMPYLTPLAEQVVEYLSTPAASGGAGVEIVDWRNLGVGDNFEVGRIPGERILEAARSLDLHDADALVLSCCVQMPSLDLIAPAEEELGLPVLSAATAGAFSVLGALGLDPHLPGAGSLLEPRAAITI